MMVCGRLVWVPLIREESPKMCICGAEGLVPTHVRLTCGPILQ